MADKREEPPIGAAPNPLNANTRCPQRFSLVRPVPWRPISVRAAVYVLLAIQIGQTILLPPTEFARSYWLINYGHGFVRRGLAGEFTELIPVTDIETAVTISAAAVTAVAIIVVICLIEALLRRRTTASAAMALLIAASPFVVDQMMYHRRPDQIGLPLLIATGFVALRASTRARWAFAGLGAGFAVSTFVHEGISLYYLPGATVLLLVCAAKNSRRIDTASVLLLALPGIAAGAVVAVLGKVTPEKAQELQESSPLHFEPSLFPFLSDSIIDSITRVVHGPVHIVAMMLMVGVALMAVHYLWIARLADIHPLTDTRSTGPAWLRIVILAFLGGGIAATFLTGVDWMRWFCIFGSVYLCLAAFDELGHRPSKHSSPESISLPLWVLPAAAYLALMLPLPEILSLHRVVHSFLFVG
jgi:hypothetical protein